MNTPNPLSRPLVATATALFVAGVVTGTSTYLARSDAPVVHHDGTSAWAVHLVLTALAAGAVVVLAARGRLRATLLAPLGRSAGRRVRLTLRTAARRPGAALRALVAVPFAALFLYGFWRAGEQVVAGLDPHFTADAWGGPSYLGAMYCHYLDGALLMAVAALALHGLLLGRGAPRTGVRTSSGVGMVEAG